MDGNIFKKTFPDHNIEYVPGPYQGCAAPIVDITKFGMILYCNRGQLENLNLVKHVNFQIQNLHDKTYN